MVILQIEVDMRVRHADPKSAMLSVWCELGCIVFFAPISIPKGAGNHAASPHLLHSLQVMNAPPAMPPPPMLSCSLTWVTAKRRVCLMRSQPVSSRGRHTWPMLPVPASALAEASPGTNAGHRHSLRTFCRTLCAPCKTL